MPASRFALLIGGVILAAAVTVAVAVAFGTVYAVSVPALLILALGARLLLGRF